MGSTSRRPHVAQLPSFISLPGPGLMRGLPDLIRRASAIFSPCSSALTIWCPSREARCSMMITVGRSAQRVHGTSTCRHGGRARHPAHRASGAGFAAIRAQRGGAIHPEFARRHLGIVGKPDEASIHHPARAFPRAPRAARHRRAVRTGSSRILTRHVRSRSCTRCEHRTCGDPAISYDLAGDGCRRRWPGSGL